MFEQFVYVMAFLEYEAAGLVVVCVGHDRLQA